MGYETDLTEINSGPVEHYDEVVKYIGLENVPEKLSLLATSVYPPMESGIFSSGIEMSLWDSNGDLIIVAKSGEDISLCGNIFCRSERIDVFSSNLENASRPVPEVNVLRHRKNQKDLPTLLRNWATAWEKGNARDIAEEFNRFMTYQINSLKFSSNKFTEGKAGDVLLALVYGSMCLYRSRIVNPGFEENLELVEWITRNI